MLRVLALLIFCLVSLLAQGAPTLAHPNHAHQAKSQNRTIHAELRTSPLDGGNCSFHHGRCCKSMCASCYLPMPPQQQGVIDIRLASSTVLPSRDDLTPLIPPGGDPPIPRPCGL